MDQKVQNDLYNYQEYCEIASIAEHTARFENSK